MKPCSKPRLNTHIVKFFCQDSVIDYMREQYPLFQWYNWEQEMIEHSRQAQSNYITIGNDGSDECEALFEEFADGDTALTFRVK